MMKAGSGQQCNNQSMKRSAKAGGDGDGNSNSNGSSDDCDNGSSGSGNDWRRFKRLSDRGRYRGTLVDLWRGSTRWRLRREGKSVKIN